MSKSLIIVTEPSTDQVVDNTTSYVSIGGLMNDITTELDRECAVKDAGVFSNLFTYNPTNTTGVTSVITLRKTNADTSVTVSYSAAQTGIKEDNANTATYTDTDTVNYKIVVPTEAGTTNITPTIFCIEFAPTTSTNCISLLVMSGGNLATASTSTFSFPNGRIVGDGQTEPNCKYRVRNSFTSSDLRPYVNANVRTTDTVFKTRKNGGDGNQSVTYTSTQTGVKIDTANSDSLVAGDDFNFCSTTSTGTGALNFRYITSSIINTSNIFPLLSGRPFGTSVNFNTTTYWPVSSTCVQTTTEANIQIYPRFTFTAKELGSYVSANTIATSATTLHLMDNGSASALTVSYDAAQTGLKNDSVNTVEITSATDEIDYRVVTPNTSGAIAFSWMGILADTSSSSIKTVNGLAIASVKTVNDLAIASVKSVNGLQ